MVSLVFAAGYLVVSLKEYCVVLLAQPWLLGNKFRSQIRSCPHEGSLEMYKRILLSLDGSALAEQALPHAVAQAEHFQAELILMKVLEPLAISHNISHEAAERVEKATHELARDYLESVAAVVREKGVSVRVVTVGGNPHAGIVSCAETEQADLIVICTRGHSGLSRWLIGSVADRVVRGAGVPVLLVSARQQEAAPTKTLKGTP